MGLYAAALEVYKADEVFDQLTDNGDTFPLLSSLEPDEVHPSDNSFNSYKLILFMFD